MTRVHVAENNRVSRILLERLVGRVERAARKLACCSYRQFKLRQCVV
jgi:hypothetical protein